MDNFNEQDHPIRLVYVTEEGTYAIHPDGANFLRKIQQPLAIVSVAGLYRTGKSYLLNRMLLNKSSGFGVGNTINACTKGLWCWSSPIKGTTPNGEKVNVIIIDSQGIGALDQDQNHDTKIFTLAVLCASTFIYNSVGSIDQTALQSLSLVVNLSKNIQINAHNQDEQVDPEELAEYFPAFCWVVRDFSLQLINENGQSITSNQYLQKALQLQKGFSDDIQNKNRIRRLLGAFFKQRQCITLIRPLVNEKKLQQLDKLQMEELRPDFVEQVLQLRKKILMKINPKKFRGQTLDGKMYLNTINSYVNAINEGAVPNMQNAWTYMCQQKCNQSLEDCLQYVIKQISQIQQSVPLQQQQITKFSEELEEQTLKRHQQLTKGMQKQAKDSYYQLKHKIKSLIRQLFQKNIKQSTTILKQYALKNFHPIEKMMSNKQFTKYQDFIKELTTYHNNLLQSGPNFVKREVIFLEFTKKAAIQGAELFLKNLAKAAQSKRALYEQEKTLLTKKSQQLKNLLQKQRKDYKEKIRQLNEQNTQLGYNAQNLKVQFQGLKSAQGKQIKSYEQKLQILKEKYETEQKSLMSEVNEVKNLLNSMEKQKYHLEKELEKSKALFEMKEEQLKTEVKSYKSRQATQAQQLLKFKRQTQGKWQKLLTEAQSRMSQWKGKCQRGVKQRQQMKQKMQELQKSLQDFKEQRQQLQTTLQQLRQDNTSQINETIKQYEDKLSLLRQKTQSFEQQNQKLFSKLQSRQREFQSLQQTLKSRLDGQKKQCQKKMAVVEQKYQFKCMEVQEIEQKKMEEQKYYEERLARLERESSEFQSKFSLQKIKQLQKECTGRIKQIEKRISQQKACLTAQLQQLSKQKSQLVFQLQISKKTVEKQVQKYSNIIVHIQHQLTEQKQLNLQLRQSFESENESKLGNLMKRIKQLQMELEEQKQGMEMQQRQTSNKSEETVMQLKNYYQMEKDRLQAKGAKDREKYEKKIQEIVNQYQQKLKQETENLQFQIQSLKQQFGAYQMEMKQAVSSIQHQLEIKTKSYENLQLQYRQQKTTFQKKQIQLFQKTETLSLSLQTDRHSFETRLNQLTKQRIRLQKQVMSLGHKQEQLNGFVKGKQIKVDSLQKQLIIVQKMLEGQRNNMKSREQQLQTEFMDKTIGYQKRLALVEQQRQFLKIRVQQLISASDEKVRAYEQKVQSMKKEMETTVSNMGEKYMKQISQIQDRLQKLKRSSKQTQTILGKRVSFLQKQCAVQKQKSQNLQTRLQEYKLGKNSTEERLNQQINMLKATFTEQKKQILQKCEQSKFLLASLQSEKQVLVSSYQKQKVLFENKIKYLDQNRDKNKKETGQKVAKMETMISKLQLSLKQQRENYQIKISEQAKRLERKFQDQVRDLHNSFDKRQTDTEEKLKFLQVQNRRLNEKLASSNLSSSQTQMLRDRKLKELQQNEKKLMKEIQILKTGAKTHSSETFLLYEKQKEVLKNKLTEKEEKLRQAEKSKQQYYFQLQKQRAKTNVQKQSLNIKIEQLRQLIGKHQRDVQRLQRQNQKLKAQKKSNKVALGRYSINRGYGGLEESLSFLNVSVASSIREKEGRSFSKAKQFTNSNSNKEKDKQNFNPILDEDSFFNLE